jgi:transposase
MHSFKVRSVRHPASEPEGVPDRTLTVDLRNGFDGLAAKAQQIIGADPFSGHLFLFRGKRGD